uniref:DUF2061 domain-containing protein n=1 Tax=Haemonchus contortus TaxID=6289 RepID=A0A7I4Z1P6_HAECO
MLGAASLKVDRVGKPKKDQLSHLNSAAVKEIRLMHENGRKFRTMYHLGVAASWFIELMCQEVWVVKAHGLGWSTVIAREIAYKKA